MKVHFELRGTKYMVKTLLFAFLFLTGLLRCLIYLLLGGYHKSTKIGLSIELIIGGDAVIGKNTHLLVLMRVRLSQKIGMIDLKNWT